MLEKKAAEFLEIAESQLVCCSDEELKANDTKRLAISYITVQAMELYLKYLYEYCDIEYPKNHQITQLLFDCDDFIRRSHKFNRREKNWFARLVDDFKPYTRKYANIMYGSRYDVNLFVSYKELKAMIVAIKELERFVRYGCK